MKQFAILFFTLLIIVACHSPHASNNPFIGRWAATTEIISSDTISKDSLYSVEFRFDKDTLYIDKYLDAKIVSTETLGIYALDGDIITTTDRYGKQVKKRFIIAKDTLSLTDIDHPENMKMILYRIREKER